MRLDKVEILIDGRLTAWSLGSEISLLTIKENQEVKIKIFISDTEEIFTAPALFVEDYPISIYRDEYTVSDNRQIIVFSSSSKTIFRESFGLALVRIFLGGEEFSFPFEVLATKLTAIQVEGMLRYLTDRREQIIRICMSRTMRPAGMKEDGGSDPEMVISSAEKIIDIILECQSELRQNIRSKLVPKKVPAWKAEQSGSLIDPIDVIFNLDSLRPSDGRQDVILRGRTYSTSSINVTALVKDANVEENLILIGGLYSIRRIISRLMDEISIAFKGHQIAAYEKAYVTATYERDYVSFAEMIMSLTGGAMYQRCKRVIASTESLIKMLENDFGIAFTGEIHPKITPYVRSSRLYRTIFEQYFHWYGLGIPSIDGNLFLIKLRSLSKIFELFVLFRLFDYLIERDWIVTKFVLNDEFDKLIPNALTFVKDEIHIVLSYEPEISKFTNRTQHMELIKLDHFDYPGKHWKPDYTMRVQDEASGLVRYLILDAKYSTPYRVEKTHIGILYNKYYDHMAIFNHVKNCISRNELLGVFAIFPEAINQVPKTISMQLEKFGIENNGPVMIPLIAGLPISLKSTALMEKWLDNVFDITMRSMNVKNKSAIMQTVIS